MCVLIALLLLILGNVFGSMARGETGGEMTSSNHSASLEIVCLSAVRRTVSLLCYRCDKLIVTSLMTCVTMYWQVTPNVTWPDVVYYNSYSTPYMGWKIHIVDNFRQKPRRSGFGAASHSLPSAVSLLACALLSLGAGIIRV